VLEEIGAGRFGPVYRARDSATGGIFAIKVFDQGLTADQAALVANALERLSQAPLDHPSIVPIAAAGSEGEWAWLAEPWHDATPLDSVMRDSGARPLDDVLVGMTQVAGALDFAGAVGIHHGALHPRDVLVSGERMALTGLGVLQALGEAGLDVPIEGAYVSPQRAHGLEATTRDDIFSLAAIAFELVYGAAVPERTQLHAAITPLTGVNTARLADVLEGSLSPEPGDRPSTALELAGALQSALLTEAARTSEIPIPIPDSEYPFRIPDSAIPILDSDSAIRDSHSDSDSDSHSDSDSDFIIPESESVPILETTIRLPNPIPESGPRGVADDVPLHRPEWRKQSGSILGLEGQPLPATRSESRIAESTIAESRIAESKIAESRIPESRIPESRILESESRNQNPASGMGIRNPESESESAAKSRYWFPVAAALAIGTLMGFASGFVVGQRDNTPAPRTAERAVARDQRPAPKEQKPTPTTGQDYTDSAVSPQEVKDEPVLPPATTPQSAPAQSVPAQSVPAQQAEPMRPGERMQRPAPPVGAADRTPPASQQEPGALQIDSRPRGAQVFVDGRLVGSTPLTLPEIRPGAHAVRLELSGHRRWVTAVTVIPGTRQRVAASLER
jgi:serine/threonine protein kinase